MKNVLTITVLTLGFASQALAGNPAPAHVPAVENVAAPVTARTDWSGFYIGGMVSFNGGDAQAFRNDVQIASFPLDATTAFGGFAGYNKQVNSFVFGAEVAYTFGDIYPTGLAMSYYTDRVDAKARVGYSLGRAMVYAVAGYSWADFSDGGALYPGSGMNYGVGVDVMMGERFFVGAEYLMRDMVGTAIGANRVDGTINSTTIRAGIKF